MDNLIIIFGLIIFTLSLILIYFFYLSQQKNNNLQNHNLEQKYVEQLEKNINQSLKKQEELLKIRLENLRKDLADSSVTLTQINNILLAPTQRGRLGNIQLDQLLSLYLPKDDKNYQLEYRLKKPTGKGGFLIVDAIVFGIDGKNNIAIDSKFPLDNYLLLNKENLSELEKKEAEKRFKNNLKDHIKKVAEYISQEDNVKNAIMFIPSEAIFVKINEHSFYEIIEFALEKKVSLCSPITLAIVINQILWVNKTYEQYHTVDQVLLELNKFWEDFTRFQERWNKVQELITKSNQVLTEFNISAQKLIKHGEDIKNREHKLVEKLD